MFNVDIPWPSQVDIKMNHHRPVGYIKPRKMKVREANSCSMCTMS